MGAGRTGIVALEEAEAGEFITERIPNWEFKGIELF